MKKALTILAGALLVPFLCSQVLAQEAAAEAKSVNAVGVVKYTLPASGELICVSLPLTPIDDPRGDGSWLWKDTSLCDQLDTGSTVYFWTEDHVWQDYTKQPTNMVYVNGWAKAANNRVLKRGESFFLRGVKNVGGEDKVISLLGELPTDEDLPYDLTGSENLDARSGTVYPVTLNFGDTDLAEQLEIGDTVYFWTEDHVWQDYSKRQTNMVYSNGWAKAANQREIKVGEGMFVKRKGTEMSITNSRPFEWDE